MQIKKASPFYVFSHYDTCRIIRRFVYGSYIQTRLLTSWTKQVRNDMIMNNELGVELRKIEIKLESFMLFATLYKEWQDYKATSNMQRDQND